MILSKPPSPPPLIFDTENDSCYDPGDGSGSSHLGRCSEDLGYAIPKKCSDFEHCVYDRYLDEFAEKTADKAWYYCDDLPRPTPYNIHHTLALVPTPAPIKHDSGYANGECDYILDDRWMYKSGDKVCDEFWYCVEEWEKDNLYSTSNKWAKGKADSAYRECSDCSGKCNDIHDRYADGKCDEDLGGWKRTCDNYYDCWLDHLKDECEYCSKDDNRNKDKCEDPFDKCYDDCLDDNMFESGCVAECDTCYCTYPQYRDEAQDAAQICLGYVDLCCNRPYDW